MPTQQPYRTYGGNSDETLKVIHQKYDPRGFFSTRTRGFMYVWKMGFCSCLKEHTSVRSSKNVSEDLVAAVKKAVEGLLPNRFAC
jgi:hypothetical protein